MIERPPLDIEHRPLHEITAEFGEAGLLDRLDYEIETTDWDEATKKLVYESLDTALSAHEGTPRGKHPYSTHFLRVAIRIMSRDHLAIRNRPELIIAALLHDTVEDNPESYLTAEEITADQVSNQMQALASIAATYSEPTAVLVSKVTNPPYPDNLTRTEKYHVYKMHVVELLSDEIDKETGAGIIKLSDFIDNCVGLIYNEDNKRAHRLAMKYLPIIPYMAAYIDSSELLSLPVKNRLSAQLARAEERCQALILAA